LTAVSFDAQPIRVLVDDRDLRGGEKNWQHVKRGVPLRVEVGPKDIAKNGVFVARRDTGEKSPMDRTQFVTTIADTLAAMQQNLFQRALTLRDEHTHDIHTLDEFRAFFTPQNADQPEIHGGFARCHFVDNEAVAEILKELKVTIRCIPLDAPEESGQCIFTGEPSAKRAIFAKAY
ncbi:MAG: hypothetical protein KDA59_11735, partial [Planctomycetales bacterium]|nr:hypothetical protein [Planctomycetales bacterium]